MGGLFVKGMGTPDSQFVKCLCQTCSGHIEYDRRRVGIVVACPHCGLDTRLYVPQVPVASRAQPTAKAGPEPEPIEARHAEKRRDEVPGRFYFYRSKEGEKGPYTGEQLRSLWTNGTITADVVYRSEDETRWMPLYDSPILKAGQGGFSQVVGRLPPLRRVQQWALTAICLLSVMAFFLPNVRVTIPIVGKVNFSMFDLIVPQFHSASKGERTQRPNEGIRDSQSFEEDVDFMVAYAGLVFCALAVLGLQLHYILTLVWGVLAFGFKRNEPLLNTVWLAFGAQFPIFFSAGARMLLAGARDTVMNELKDNPFGILGFIFMNNVSVSPGVVMWFLMVICLETLALPLIARNMAIPWDEGSSAGAIGKAPRVSSNANLPELFRG